MASRFTLRGVAFAVLKLYVVAFAIYRLDGLVRKLAWSLHCQSRGCFDLPHQPLWAAAGYLLLGLIGAVPLLGFALNRPILRGSVWAMWLVFSIAWSAIDMALMSDELVAKAPPELGPLLTSIMALVFVAPCWLAVYWYALRSPQLWERAA